MSPQVVGALTVGAFALPSIIGLIGRSAIARWATIVGAGVAAFVAGPADAVTQGGFSLDAWRGLLVVALAVGVAASAWLEDRFDPFLSLEAAGVSLALLAGHGLVSLGGLVAATTAATAGAWLSGPPLRNAFSPAKTRAGVLIAADFFLGLGLFVGANEGLLGVPRLGGVAGLLVVLAIAARLGAAIVWTAQPERPVAASLLAGLPAVLLASWLVPSTAPAKTLLVGAAVAACLGAWRAARVGDVRAVAGPYLALGVVAIALGASATVTAAIGLVAAAVLAPALVSIAPGAILLTAAIPGALALPSVLALADAAVGIGVERPEAVIVAALVLATSGLLVVGAFAGVRAPVIPRSLEGRIGAGVALGGLAIAIGVGAPALFADAGRDAAIALGTVPALPVARAPLEGALVPLAVVALVATLLASRQLSWGTVWPPTGELPADPVYQPNPAWVRAVRRAAAIGLVVAAGIIWKSISNGWL